MTDERASQANLQDLTVQGYRLLEIDHRRDIARFQVWSESGPYDLSMPVDRLKEVCLGILRDLDASPEMQIVGELRKIQGSLESIAEMILSRSQIAAAAAAAPRKE